MLSLLVRDNFGIVLGFAFVSSSLFSLAFSAFCIISCIALYHMHLTSLALELFWNDKSVFACASLYRCLLDHGWLSSFESVEY